jgi:hypothetical protein
MLVVDAVDITHLAPRDQFEIFDIGFKYGGRFVGRAHLADLTMKYSMGRENSGEIIS